MPSRPAIVFVLALPLLLWTAPLSATDTILEPPRVTVAEPLGAWQLRPDEPGVRLPLADTAGSAAVAVDPAGQLTWLRTGEGLRAFDRDGALAGGFPLALPPAAPHLTVVPEDGSLWLGEGTALRAFGSGGQLLHEQTMASAIVDLALDPERRVLWVVTAGGAVAAFDAVAGVPLTPLVAPEAAATAGALAVDPRSGELWVGHATGLQRLGSDGRLLAEIPAEVQVSRLATVVDEAALIGVWAVMGERVFFYSPEGEVYFELQPFAEGAVVAALAVDPASGSAWLSDGRRIVELTTAGEQLLHDDLGPAGGVTALGVLHPAREARAPSLEILQPTPGTVTSEQRPEIVVRITPGDGRVVPESLKVTVGGFTLEVECSYLEEVEEVMTCLPVAPLPEGEVVLAATVADDAERRSEPAVVSFTVRLESEPPPSPDRPVDDPDEIPPSYTPVVSPRGLRPDTPFVFPSGLDHVDTSSGNLTIRLPLGQEYSVGPLLSYRLQVVYNSKLWEHHEVLCTLDPDGCGAGDRPTMFALTNPGSNAGLGWELHFGRLYPPEAPRGLLPDQWLRWPNRDFDSRSQGRWMYVAPDGAVTYLYKLESYHEGTPALPVRYSKDGTNLRLRQTSATTVLVEFPNGLVSEFEQTNQLEGTEFCGNGVSGCWRLRETRDGYGNKVSLAYASPSPAREVWTVSDSTGRSHTIEFQRGNGATGGGDCTAQFFCTEEGHEWGDSRRVVDKVTLASFDSGSAVYDFTTELRRIKRGCPHDGERLPVGADSIRLPILTEISVPHSQPYRITTLTASPTGGNCDAWSGAVSSLQTPSRARIEYQYTDWEVPTRCSYQHDPEAQFSTPSLGIHKRKSWRPNGTLEGEWTYSSTLEPALNGSQLSGANCARADYRVTTVDAPLDGNAPQTHTRTKFFNAVHQAGRHPLNTTPIRQWQVTDNGLPYTKAYRKGSGDGDYVFLSQEVSHCTGATCVKKRSTYLRYASVFVACSKATGDGADCFKRDAQRVRERVVFHDDAETWIDTAHVDYRGAGHFRRQSVRDNFKLTSVSERWVDTEWNVGTTAQQPIDPTTGYLTPASGSSFLPGLGAPWIIDAYNKKTSFDDESDRTYVTRYEFNNKGVLKCTRRLKGSTHGPQDLVVELVRGSSVGSDAGMPVQEIVAGGENGTLGPAGICSEGAGTASNGSRYVIDHQFQSYALSRSGVAGYPNWYRADVDRNTGLARATYDAADQKTTHTFDQLGRLTRSEPEASLQAATLELSYDNPPDADPSIVERQLEGSTELTWQKSIYDSFGRVIEEQRRRSTGATTTARSIRKRRYDGAGYLRFESTWQDSASFNPGLGTTYNFYDAFGRPWRVVAADGTIEDREHYGERRTLSKVAVRTSLSGTTTAITTTIKDAAGQVVKVHAPQHDNFYTYDPYGQKVAAERRSLGTPAQLQRREYGFDARGLLLSERHPESGLAGNGWITYHPDAFGQPRRLRDGQNDLTYLYDAAGRLYQVKETSGRLLKEWTWGTANAGNDFRKGKVVTAKRHNYPLNDAMDWLVVDQYEYRGAAGQRSLRKTHLEFPWVPQSGPTFSQGYVYDRLGNLTQLSYPSCAAAACNGVDDQPAPVHTVTTSYNQGAPWKVTSSRGPWGEIAYHPNFQLARIDYSNNVDGVFDQGTNGMARPRRLRYLYNDSLVRFGTAFYEYDGAGNVWQIGNDRYLYDTGSRLTYGKVSQGVGAPTESYVYDAFDNILSITQSIAGTIPYPTSPATNRYLGGQNEIRYDGAGNLLEIGVVGGGPQWEIEYDPLNMQRRFISNDVPVSDYLYAYDANDHRLVTFNWHTGDLRYHFRDLGGRILRELRVSGSGGVETWNSWSHQKDYVYGPQGLLATVSRSGEQMFYHQDHLGTPRAITNVNGVLRGRYDYFPFGQETPRANPLDDWNVKFTGHQRDPHGLADYMMARTCLWPLRRFASVDPGRDGWNLYAYALNNPIKYVDPDGRASAIKDTGVFERNAEAREEVQVYLEEIPVVGSALAFTADLILSGIAPANAAEANSAIFAMASPIRLGKLPATGGAAVLQSRANQIHGALDPIAQAQRTTAVLETNVGRIVAGGARDLSPAQRAVLEAGEEVASLPGAHAEITALAHAEQKGLVPMAMAVTRTICPACAALLEASGGRLTSATTVVWP